MRTVYEVMDLADSAYIMHKGKLTFELSQDDRYTVEGKEIIFGAEEPLIAYKTSRDEYFRFQTVYVDDDAIIDKIPSSNLYKVMSNYNIGFSIIKNIAKCLEITNQIYIRKEQMLSGHEMASKDYARIYVEIIDRLKEEYKKYKTDWLYQLIERFSNSLVYAKGRAFKGSSAQSELKLKTEKLSEYTFDLRAGSLICEEGDTGHEMFILNRGNLEVYIGGKKVADINEPGTVIGEMALLLGEKRTATVKTVTDCNITIVKPENLKEIAQGQKDLFLKMAVNLGKRLENNCMLIRETNEILLESKAAERPVPPMERTNYKELLGLLREIERYEVKYKNAWLFDILNESKEKINKVRNSLG